MFILHMLQMPASFVLEAERLRILISKALSELEINLTRVIDDIYRREKFLVGKRLLGL